MKQLQLLPAIDIKKGEVFQAKNSISSKISGSPQQVIDFFVSQGTKWIHLVDLDAAFSTGNNFESINNLIAANDVAIQLSGGITNQTTLNNAFKTNAKWINLSTGSLTDLD